MTARAQQPGRPGGRGRSFTDILLGLAALAALIALTVGVPLLLVRVFGAPVPHTAPSLSLLTHRLDITAVIRICVVVVWLAWLQLAWCVIAEVSAAVRNRGMPRRVPLAGGTQAMVHRLVSAVLLLSSATTLSPALMHHAAPLVASAGVRPAGVAFAAPAGPRMAQHGGQAGLAQAGTAPARTAGFDGARNAGEVAVLPATAAAARGSGLPGAAVAGPAAPGNGHAGAELDLAAAVRLGPAEPGHLAGAAGVPGYLAGRSHTEKIYVVKPPEGRFHESLWEIAENHLGDGRRYREIFELNKDRTQPDGSKLTIASLIRPGWVLVMPHDAHGPGIEVVRVGPHGQPGHQAHHARHGAAGQRHVQATPLPRHKHDPAAAARAPAQATPRASAPAPAGQGGQAPHQPAPAGTHQGIPAYPFELAGAGLLAAGVLAALRRRRRKQARHRPAGRRIVTPSPDAAWAEAALRLGEDGAAAAMVDAGLRYLGDALVRQGRTPPTVFAAHVGDENLDLWVAPAGHDTPSPWYAVGDGQVWRLPLAAVPDLDHAALEHAAPPYPGLVTIGTDTTGRVLVDVASAHGLIAVAGPQEMVSDALTAIATELATSYWSEGIHLTLVGFGADLAVFAPGRVHLAASLAEALPDLEAWAAEVADVMATVGGGSADQVRAEGMRAGAWEPHFVITAVPPASAWERDRLLALARTGQAAGAGYLAAGEVPGASWTWELSGDGRLRAGQLGLDVAAQLVPHEQELAMVELFSAAGDLAGVPLSAPPADLADPGVVDLAAGGAGEQAPVEVTLLGPLAVRTAGEIEPDRLAIATEIVVYLASHPAGVHPNVLTAAIWPRGVTPEVRDAVLGRVRDWLGSDGIGRPHLASDATGRLRLGSGVRVDWYAFCALIARAADAARRAIEAGEPDSQASMSHTAAEASLLEEALALVTGPFLANRGRGRYAWLATGDLEYEVEARVADVAHRLFELRIDTGDPRGAMAAIQAGLRLAGQDELLWRDLLLAAHATGDEALLRSVVSEVCARATGDDTLPGLSPETGALIGELLPSWRWPAA
jgi:MYXO-CTERM domain-containing protein